MLNTGVNMGLRVLPKIAKVAKVKLPKPHNAGLKPQQRTLGVRG